jgi:hypothetical protein
MAKLSVLCAFIVLAIAKPAAATFGPFTATFLAGANLKKLSADTYEFTYNCDFFDVTPSSVRSGEFTVYCFPYPPSAITHLTGDFGIPMDDYYVYDEAGTYTSHSLFGQFRTTQAPRNPLLLSAEDEVEGDYWRDDGSYAGRDLVGSIRGSAHLFGSIPTNIGESTTWAVTPEPPSAILGALLLAGFCVAKRKALRQALL